MTDVFADDDIRIKPPEVALRTGPPSTIPGALRNPYVAST